MRIGQNPSKMRGSPAYTPKRVGLVTLTYIPDLEGYFRQGREVLSVHLASLRESLQHYIAHSEGVDLGVFDNGSCPEVVRDLEEQWQAGLIDWLVLSRHNLGKNGALNWIFGALPNELIGFSDYDVYFRMGWLEKSLAIFDAFPGAGMVSAQPVFFDFLRGQGKTVALIRDFADQQSPGAYTFEDFRPRPEVLDEYCEGINATPEQRQQFEQARLQAVRHHGSGVRAVTSATDMQFMVRREVARQVIPLPIAGALSGRDAIAIPQGIEKVGSWILSCDEPLVRHMGNTVLDRAIPEIDAVLEKLSVHQPSQPVMRRANVDLHPRGIKNNLRAQLQRGLDRSPRLRRMVTRLYDNLFSLLYEER